MQTSSNRWALILAAGSGTRLRGLTADGTGTSVPKQFCSLAGGPSLLEGTFRRAAALSSPAQVCFVVAAEHRRFWDSALAHVARENVIVQPRNRGTANGILLGLSAILARDGDAIVAILPSDHYVEHEGVLGRALDCATAAIESASAPAITFLGIAPDAADPELGYIVPGARRTGRLSRIARFVEKPAQAVAARLVRRGALWNSFIIVARASALAELVERRFPAEAAAFRRLWRRGAAASAAVERLYESLPEIDFSRHVVEGANADLGVLAVAPCGWSDLGTPQRVGAALARLGAEPARLAAGDDRPYRHFNLAEAHARLMGRLAPAAQTA